MMRLSLLYLAGVSKASGNGNGLFTLIFLLSQIDPWTSKNDPKNSNFCKSVSGKIHKKFILDHCEECSIDGFLASLVHKFVSGVSDVGCLPICSW